MMNFAMRCKLAALVATIMVSNTFGIVGVSGAPVVSGRLASFSRIVPGKKAAIVAATVTLIAMWIRLNTKGSSFDYKLADAREDFDLFLKSLNIFDAESRKVLLKLFDKWIIGRQFSLVDVSYKGKNEKGEDVTTKDKKIKAKPFGVMGFVDAYFLIQLKKINEYVKEIQTVQTLLKDPVLVLTKDAK